MMRSTTIRQLLTHRYSQPSTKSFSKLQPSPSPSRPISSSILQIHPEVKEALSSHRPVVALESTILTHGLPHPDNLQLSKDISTIIRSKGAVPATIAVKDGVCHVGLTSEDMEDLVVAGVEERAVKCSTRDLPFLLGKSQFRNETKLWNGDNGGIQWGATTVASTMKIAHQAGISTFVTGGTGGVHRHGEITMDISSDLTELHQTPIIVISAGVKSILDISKTLEVLETYGVPVATYRGDDFPAFFSKHSGVKTPMRVEDVKEIAYSYMKGLEFGMENGMLIAVPNDSPAVDGENVERAIEEAIEELEHGSGDMAVTGRDVTPFILKRVNEKTGGDSLRSNIALVKRNAEVGTDIAIEVAKLKKRRSVSSISSPNSTTSSNRNHNKKSRVIVVGGSIIDIISKSNQKIIPSTSNPGSCVECHGGVARNIADVLMQLNANPIFYTAIGDDERGRSIQHKMEVEYGYDDNNHNHNIPIVERHHMKIVPNSNTATYLAILDQDGDLHTAIASDMNIHENIPIPDEDCIKDAEYIVIDANPPVDTLLKVVQLTKGYGNGSAKVVFDPTSVPKAKLLKGRDDFWSCITFAFPNIDELLAVTDQNEGDVLSSNHWFENDFKKLKSLTNQLLEKMHPQSSHVIVTLGPKGAFLASKETSINHNDHDNNQSLSSSRQLKYRYKHFPVKEESIIEDVENCTGAGDTMVGVVVKSLLDGNTIIKSIEKGMDASLASIKYADGAIPKLDASH